MKLLKELLALTESSAAPVEIADVVEHFPNKKREAVLALLDKGRLHWHGKEIMQEWYPKIEDAVGDFIEDADAFDASLDVPDGDDILTVEWENKLDKREMQEVYLAYDASNDEMIIGYDVWAAEDDFNEGFDKSWQENGSGTDEEEVFAAAWELYKDQGIFYGVSFRVKPDGSVEEDIPPMPGGFYKGVRKLIAQNQHIVEIRLD